MAMEAMTDEELAWHLARQMEEEEREQERRDAEMARRLYAQYEESDASPSPPKPFPTQVPTYIPPPPSLPPRLSPPASSSHRDDQIDCPICSHSFPMEAISDHVEVCLTTAPQEEELRRSNGIKIEHKGEHDPVTLHSFECPICMDDVDPGAGYKFEHCGHEYCGVCLEAYYIESINKREVEDMVCPFPKCGSKVTSFDLEYILAPDMYAKYQLFLRNSRIEKDPTMRWCPNPGCETPVKRTDTQNLLMVCGECSTEFCYSCAGKFHPGKKCEDAAKFSFEGWRNKVWKSFNTKPCPKCEAPIAKSSGCNHMTCGSCKFEFCWLCKQPFSWSHWSDSACTMYGGSFNVLGIAKRIVMLPKMIKSRMEQEEE